MSADTFTKRQREIALRIRMQEVEEINEAKRDAPAELYLQKLMWDLYTAHKDKRTVTMGAACAAIPLKHPSMQRKYVQLAHSQGLVIFRPHGIDGRRTRVLPTAKLIKQVDDEILRMCNEFIALVKEFKSAGDKP